MDSFDDRISARLGIDNRLCPIHQSISFWGLVGMAAIVFFAAAKEARVFFAAGTADYWAAYIFVVVAALVFYAAGRMKVTRLAQLHAIAENDDAMRMLRFIPYVLGVLAGLVLMCVFFAVLIVRR